MSKRDNQLLLQDMKESAEKILRYTKSMTFEDFLNNDKTSDAVTKKL